MKNSYNKSPLKQTKGGEEESNKTVEKKGVRVGNLAATKTTTTVREVKKSATGAKVEAKKSASGRNVKAYKNTYNKDLGPNYKPSKAAIMKQEKALADAKAKDAAEAKANAGAAPEAMNKTAEQSASGTTSKVELDKAKASPGTRSSTFHPWEQRQQNRREKIVKRQERQMGKQELRRDWRSMKNHAEWGKMTSEERKAAKYEFRHGKTKDQTTSNLDRFGKDFSSNVEQSRKRKEGQGELNKAQVRQEVERPGEATTTQMDQNLKGARRGDVSRTGNYEDVKKEVKEGDPVVLSDAEMASREAAELGTKVESTSSASSKEMPAPRTNTPNSDTNATKASNRFTEMMAKQTSVLGAKPSEYNSKLVKPEVKPTAETKFSRGEKMLEEDTPLKMRKSNFNLKGFGSKSGYNFNKNK